MHDGGGLKEGRLSWGDQVFPARIGHPPRARKQGAARSISRCDSLRSVHGRDGDSLCGVGLEPGDDAPQATLPAALSRASEDATRLRSEARQSLSLLAASATVRNPTTGSRIGVSWQRRPYIEADTFVMTYINAWPDRWRGSNDLGRDIRGSVSYLRLAKLCDWIKNFHKPSLVLAHIFAEGKSLKDVNSISRFAIKLFPKTGVSITIWVCPRERLGWLRGPKAGSQITQSHNRWEARWT